jgi:glycosyltransferase involved in cell wall biosynthesis
LLGWAWECRTLRAVNWSAECAVVIPCLNEAPHIRAVIEGARRHLPRVIVVEDGSRDATARLAREAGAEVIEHGQSRGKGAALRTGIDHSIKNGFAWVVAMDGDGQHLPADIPKFLAAADRETAKMIVGDRLRDTREMPRTRLWVNRWMTRTLSDFCGVELRDSQCGFRMIDLESWRELTFSARHFEVESELIVRFAAAGFPIRSVPVRTVYGSERSKIHPLRDTFRWLIWWRSIRRELGRQAANWPRPQLSHDVTV